MKRNLLKAAEDYQRLTEKLDNGQGSFYVPDVVQIMEACNEKPLDVCYTALQAGFMVGYRFAKKQEREGRRGE